MYIRFKDEKTIYSFNEKELNELDNLVNVFKQYGSINLEEIRKAITTQFAVKIIPLFYKVHTKELLNVCFDMKDEYKEFLLDNHILYTEYGLFIQWGLRQLELYKNPFPKYLEDEINKYELLFSDCLSANPIYNKKLLSYKTKRGLYIDKKFVKEERPYERPVKLSNEERFWLFDPQF